MIYFQAQLAKFSCCHSERSEESARIKMFRCAQHDTLSAQTVRLTRKRKRNKIRAMNLTRMNFIKALLVFSLFLGLISYCQPEMQRARTNEIQDGVLSSAAGQQPISLPEIQQNNGAQTEALSAKNLGPAFFNAAGSALKKSARLPDSAIAPCTEKILSRYIKSVIAKQTLL